jgi:RNA polymerase sigma-70 factor (ECF subfamily)
MAAVSNVHELDVAQPAPPRGARCRAHPVLAAAQISVLFRQHAKFIARSLRRLGVPESDVEDAVQEVFVVASRKIDAIAEGSERSFLYGTAMRIASNALRVERRAQTRRAEAPVETAEIDTAPTADELVDRRNARAALDAVLETMSQEMRAVFTLFELEEMTTAEIASLLGVPAGTVSSRLRRAREHFYQQVRAMQAQLDRQGRTS